MGNTIKHRFITAAKLILLAVVLVFLDVVLRYILETSGIIRVTPYTIPFSPSLSHVRNVIGGIIYVSVFALWAYVLAVVVFHYLKKEFPNGKPHPVRDGLVGVSIFYLFFFFYWVFVEDARGDVLVEGLVVYALLGVVLYVAHKALFKPEMELF